LRQVTFDIDRDKTKKATQESRHLGKDSTSLTSKTGVSLCRQLERVVTLFVTPLLGFVH